MKVVLALACLALAAPAAAQTTVCEDTIYGQPGLGVTCHTSQPVVEHAAKPEHCRGFFSGVLVDGDSPSDVRHECDVAKAKKAIGDLLANGRCDDAVQSALRLGDLTYARQVRDFCADQGRR